MGESITSTLRNLIAELAQTRPDTLDFSRRMDEQGIYSLHLIVLRERLQESLRVAFSDEEWGSLDTPAGIAAAIERVTAAGLATRTQSGASAAVDEDLEIGMRPAVASRHAAHGCAQP